MKEFEINWDRQITTIVAMTKANFTTQIFSMLQKQTLFETDFMFTLGSGEVIFSPSSLFMFLGQKFLSGKVCFSWTLHFWFFIYLFIAYF